MTKKKGLIANPNTSKSNVSKLGRDKTDPNMLYDYKQYPISEGRINRLIDALKIWLEKNPDAIEIQEFYLKEDVAPSTYYKLLERSIELKELHDKTMMQLGNRILKQSVYFKANWNAVKTMLPMYGPHYSKMREDEAMVNAKAREHVDASSGPQIVVIEKFPDSLIVPEKKK